jgi:hypothetical protein
MSKQEPLLMLPSDDGIMWPNLFDESREMLEGMSDFVVNVVVL